MRITKAISGFQYKGVMYRPGDVVEIEPRFFVPKNMEKVVPPPPKPVVKVEPPETPEEPKDEEPEVPKTTTKKTDK